MWAQYPQVIVRGRDQKTAIKSKCHSIPTTRKSLVYMFCGSIYYMQLLSQDLLEFRECVRECKEFGQWVFVGKV